MLKKTCFIVQSMNLADRYFIFVIFLIYWFGVLLIMVQIVKNKDLKNFAIKYLNDFLYNFNDLQQILHYSQAMEAIIYSFFIFREFLQITINLHKICISTS